MKFRFFYWSYYLWYNIVLILIDIDKFYHNVFSTAWWAVDSQEKRGKKVRNIIITSFYSSNSDTNKKKDFVSLTDCLHTNNPFYYLIFFIVTPREPPGIRITISSLYLHFGSVWSTEIFVLFCFYSRNECRNCYIIHILLLGYTYVLSCVLVIKGTFKFEYMHEFTPVD